MSRLIDLEIRTGMLWFSFPSDPRVEAAVKSLPGRRYDPEKRRWGVSMVQITEVVAQLEPLHFHLTPRCRDYWLKARGDAETSRTERSRFEIDPADGLTVSGLNGQVRRALQQNFPDDVWLIGELDGIARNRSTRNLYFELVERIVEGGDPIAKVSAMMFSNVRAAIEAKMGEVGLADGMIVRLKGRVSLYERQGRYQFQVEDIDAEWSVGALKRKRDKILDDLAKTGKIDDNRNLPLPLCPLRVGLITATSSDAYNDFVHELERSGFGFEVVVHDATMQGPNTEPSILEALRWFYRRAEQFDVVAIVRGGGARSDLTSFDSFALGRAVCWMPIKVVCGVGHHRDQCVLDFVAHSEKTPTAAAQWIGQRVADFMRRVDDAQKGAVNGTQRRIDTAQARLERLGNAWQRRTSARLRGAEDRLRRNASLLQRSTQAHVDGRNAALRKAARRLELAADRRLTGAEHAIEASLRALEPRKLDVRFERNALELERATNLLERAIARRLTDDARRVDHLNDTLRLCDPRRVVERGYAIVRDPEGAVVTSAKALRALDEAAIEMRDGKVTVIPRGEDDDGR